MSQSNLAVILRRQEAALLTAWTAEQSKSDKLRKLVSDGELTKQSREFLELLQQAVTEAGDSADVDVMGGSFRELRGFLDGLATTWAQAGLSPADTARFLFSFKQPLFAEIARMDDAKAQVDTLRSASMMLDNLGLLVTELHQKKRESVIVRQQQEMLEISTPVVKLWDGVLALPIIGTLDSSRTQTIMESLLEKIVETGSEIAIIDITGVPTVDTLTAQHLLKTVTAARLMGAECIISGIRPQIAQTIVHLGLELGDVMTKASLADAFKVALQRTNYAVVKRAAVK